MNDIYTPKEAAELTGASRQVLRVYTKLYARYLSTDATPGSGLERRFTLADLRLLAYVYQRTAAGETHDQVAARLAAGELETFAWAPPEPAAEPQPAESASSALIPIERLQAAQALLLDAQRRELAAADQVAALQSQVSELQRELGKAQGELQGFRSAQYRAPTWWRRLFGGRVE